MRAFRTERSFQQAFRLALEHEALEGGFAAAWWKVHGGPLQVAGISDLIGCVDGIFVAIEFKYRGALTLRQRAYLISVADAGGLACVAYPGEMVYMGTKDGKHGPAASLVQRAWATTMRGYAQ